MEINNKNIDQRKCLQCDFHYSDDGGLSCTRKPMVYLSHAYGGKKENADEVAMVMLKLVRQYPNSVFFSPIHNFPFYEDMDYEIGLQRCLDFLPYCHSMIVIGEYKDSNGCLAEIEFCKKHGIPIVYKSVDEIMKEGM